MFKVSELIKYHKKNLKEKNKDLLRFASLFDEEFFKLPDDEFLKIVKDLENSGFKSALFKKVEERFPKEKFFAPYAFNNKKGENTKLISYFEEMNNALDKSLSEAEELDEPVNDNLYIFSYLSYYTDALRLFLDKAILFKIKVPKIERLIAHLLEIYVTYELYTPNTMNAISLYYALDNQGDIVVEFFNSFPSLRTPLTCLLAASYVDETQRTYHFLRETEEIDPILPLIITNKIPFDFIFLAEKEGEITKKYIGANYLYQLLDDLTIFASLGEKYKTKKINYFHDEFTELGNRFYLLQNGIFGPMEDLVIRAIIEFNETYDETLTIDTFLDILNGAEEKNKYKDLPFFGVTPDLFPEALFSYFSLLEEYKLLTIDGVDEIIKPTFLMLCILASIEVEKEFLEKQEKSFEDFEEKINELLNKNDDEELETFFKNNENKFKV